MAEAGRLLELAERVEREEPSRALDAAIWEAIGLTAAQEAHCASWRRMDNRTDLTRERYIDAWAPDFTTKIDAAATLVPTGRGYVLRCYGDGAGSAIIPDRPRDVVFGRARVGGTVAAALCAAALRARAAAMEKTDG